MTPVSVAILDDFQNVTRGLADWGRLPPHVSVTIFNEHFEGEELIRRISPFDVLVITREPDAIPAQRRGAAAETEASGHGGIAQSRHRLRRLPRPWRSRL